MSCLDIAFFYTLLLMNKNKKNFVDAATQILGGIGNITDDLTNVTIHTDNDINLDTGTKNSIMFLGLGLIAIGLGIAKGAFKSKKRRY